MPQNHHGRIRPQLDKFNKVRFRPMSVYKVGSFVPILPSTKVKTCVGSELEIILQKEVEVGEDGSPILSQWEYGTFY